MKKNLKRSAKKLRQRPRPRCQFVMKKIGKYITENFLHYHTYKISKFMHPKTLFQHLVLEFKMVQFVTIL